MGEPGRPGELGEGQAPGAAQFADPGTEGGQRLTVGVGSDGDLLVTSSDLEMVEVLYSAVPARDMAETTGA